jgi:nucleotide-binding universal stress UspA family protein
MTAAFQEILVPVDGSEGSQRAVRFADRLAAATGTPLKLIFVFSLPPTEFVTVARLSKEDIDNVRNSAARNVFATARAALTDAGREVQEEVLFGDPAPEILHYINERPDALVVMGRRGLTRMESLMLGSVSEKVVRHAKGSVTIVN